MKKVIFFAFFISLLLFSFISCNKAAPLAPGHIPDVKLDKDYDPTNVRPDRQNKI